MKYYFSVNLFLILMLIWLRVDKHPGDQKRLIAYESRLGDFLGDLLRGSAGFCLKCKQMIDHQTVHQRSIIYLSTSPLVRSLVNITAD